MSQTNTWDVQITGTTPCSPEGDTKCINGYTNVCTLGVWKPKTPAQTCGGAECDQYTTQGQTACETAGCYWYAYPNPFGEPACFGEPIYIKFLPFIAVGVGALLVAAFLLTGRKKSPPMMFYPPPQYYPPAPYNPPSKKKGGK